MLKNKQTVPAVKQETSNRVGNIPFFKPFSASASDKAGKRGGDYAEERGTAQLGTATIANQYQPAWPNG